MADTLPTDSGSKLPPASPTDIGNLPQLVTEITKIEFKTSEDLMRYAKLTRQIGLELYMRMSMDADVIAAILGRYKGRWFTFGVQSKVRGKLVGAHLKLGAEAVKIFGLAGIKMYSSYIKHFVKPEIEAKAKGERNKADGFTITETNGKGRAA
ncbi:hypothetical protein AB0O82_32680 [Kitasatospora sp. NPDC088264]|uniref:hypothetical protein n=1 Tax=Kitasatospora sp. NPDC088264 TaxID=3155296 RepID=UPI00342C1C90